MEDILIYRNEKLLEACRHVSKATGQLVYDICYVIDLEGNFRIPEAEAITVHKELNHLDRWYYPHVYGRIVIINAPLMFERSWRINKRVLLPDTLKKIEILGVEDIHKLTTIIDKDQLPEKYGGRNKLPTFIPSKGEGYYSKGESKLSQLEEEDSKYNEDSKYSEEKRDSAPTRRLSAINGLKSLSRRLSTTKDLFGF
jgi:hypothetical protein